MECWDGKSERAWFEDRIAAANGIRPDGWKKFWCVLPSFEGLEIWDDLAKDEFEDSNPSFKVWRVCYIALNACTHNKNFIIQIIKGPDPTQAYFPRVLVAYKRTLSFTS